MRTRRKLLETHDNDYGFDVANVLTEKISSNIDLPMVSVVIPYYETGDIFDRCLHFLYNAIANYSGRVEVVVVDDGSRMRPLVDHVAHYSDIRPIFLQQNSGRTEARNTGLSAATGEIILFLDSDVLIDDQLINNHIKLHLSTRPRGKKSVCISFFEFTNKSSKKLAQSYLKSENFTYNDFRIDCIYESTWIGCDDDKQYIGEHMRLIEETNNLRAWHGQYKAWMLPNMVLGGAFSVYKREIDAVGGFDSRFVGYGFTETSAVTRMISERDNVVVPCIVGGGIHIEDEVINIPQVEKDNIFRIKHDFYFNTFLLEEVA